MSNDFYKRFVDLKRELNVPKDITNRFGGFKYRSKENIQEKLKPLEHKHEILVKVDDSIVTINERIFIKATAVAIDIRDGLEKLEAVAFAEFQPKDGSTKMNESQLTGSASSYAGKYALSNLLGLDDNRDGDSEQETPKKSLGATPVPKPVQPKVNVDETKKKLYDLSQASLTYTTVGEINKALDTVDSLGGDQKTTLVLNTKAKQLGFIHNLKTKRFEERK